MSELVFPPQHVIDVHEWCLKHHTEHHRVIDGDHQYPWVGCIACLTTWTLDLHPNQTTLDVGEEE